MKRKEIFSSKYHAALNTFKLCSKINAETIRNVLQDEINFLEENKITPGDWNDLKEVYIKISEHLNNSGDSWDDVIEELEREYKYVEYKKEGIRFSRTGQNQYEEFGHVFNNIPIEQLLTIFAKFSASENYSENVNFLNFQIYTGVHTKKENKKGSPSRREQAMAFYYLLKAAGVNVGQIEKAKLAAFLHFLSGENEPERMESSQLNKQFKILHNANYIRHNQVIRNIVEKMTPISEQDESGLFREAIKLLNQTKKNKS